MIQRNYPKKWIEHTVIVLLWLLLGSVSLFTLANLFAYFFVPVDGATVWVRQGPITVLNSAAPEETGLQAGDVIRQIQGHDLDWWLAQRWQTLPGIIARMGRAEPTTAMTVARQDQIQTRRVPLLRHPAGETGWLFFTHLIVGTAFLSAGIFILKLRGWDPIGRRVVLIMALLALIEQNEIPATLGAELGWSMLWLFIPLRLLTRWFAYSHVLVFSLTFPSPKQWLIRVPYGPLIIHLLNPIVTLVIMAGVQGNLHHRHAVAYGWSKLIYSVYLLVACLILVHTYLTTHDVTSKSQLRWIAWGVVMAIVPNVLLVDLSFLLLGYRLLPIELASLLLLFVPVAVAVAILRYRLWEIELLIKASLVYGTLSVLLGVVYLVLVSILVALLGWAGATNGQSADNVGVFFFSALVVAFLVTPGREYVQRVIDRYFFRNRLNYPQILTEMSRALVTSLLLEDLHRLLTEAIPARLNLIEGQVIFDNLPPENSPEYRQLKQGHLIWLRHPRKTVTSLPDPLNHLQEAGLWACVPLLSGEELLGLYGLGPKKSGEYYRYEEVTLLETLARQAGIALKNAQLHKSLSAQVRIQRDLEIARQIQLSLLPAQDPQMLGLDIVGFSIPAQKVGGDFYHYFKFDEDRIGIAVGDVSGKGVAAALFMAVSISTLRAQSPHHRQPAHLIGEMNNLLHLQMKVRKMNTALLYLIIERQVGGEITLNASNAGLISPLLRRAHQKTEYIDVRGLPLGIMEHVEYNARRVNLGQDDLILLCSDGIVEALNERGEMFGFQRLEQFMIRCPNLSAAQVVKRLHKEVTTFVGKAEQHDDITLVAIRVL